MLSHGFITAALFLCVGVLLDRTRSQSMDAFGGVVHRMPFYALLFMIFAMGTVGLPGTAGFIGEILVIVGALKVNFWVATLTGNHAHPQRRIYARDVPARGLRCTPDASRTARH